MERKANCQEHYGAMLTLRGDAFAETCTYQSFHLQAKSHLLLCDIDAWHTALPLSCEKEILKICCDDFHKALLFVVTAEYKAAFFYIRSCLELGLLLLEHSAHSIYYRQWINGDKDLIWSSLINPDDGVLSKRYAKAYFPDLAEEVAHINAIAKTSYRRCSEFVHNNPCTWPLIPEKHKASETIFKEWHERASSISYVLLFGLSMRFLSELEPEKLTIIEPVLAENLLHLNPIQLYLQKPKG